MIRRVIQSRSGVAFVFALVTVSVIGGMVLGQLGEATVIRSRGTVKSVGVGVYWDSDCSDAVSSIEWGMLEPGSERSVSIYIRNEGNTEIKLYSSIENWNPETAADYINLTWDYAELGLDPTSRPTLMPNQVIQVILTLSLSKATKGITNFTFDIVIIGIG